MKLTPELEAKVLKDFKAAGLEQSEYRAFLVGYLKAIVRFCQPRRR